MADTDAASGNRSALSGSHGRLMNVRELPALAFLLMAGTLLWLKAPNFGSSDNLFSIAQDMSVIGIMGAGMTMVILTSGIDLSVASILAFSASIMGMRMVAGADIWLSVLIALAVGTGCGMLNAAMINTLRVPPIITTLGTMGILRAATFLYTDSAWIGPLPAEFTFIGIKFMPIVLLIAVAGAVTFYLWKCRFGRYTAAVGGNEEAVRLSGIRVDRVKMLAYTLNGFLAAVAGLILAASRASAQASMASGYELNVIAAVVIGGTSISGGQGSVPGTIIGAGIMSVLSSALILLGASIYWHKLIIGAVILAAVLVDRLRYLRSQ